MKRVLCDKCGKDCSDGRYKEIAVNLRSTTEQIIKKDFCITCVQRLRTWLDNPDPIEG